MALLTFKRANARALLSIRCSTFRPIANIPDVNDGRLADAPSITLLYMDGRITRRKQNISERTIDSQALHVNLTYI